MDVNEFLQATGAPVKTLKVSDVENVDLDLNDEFAQILEDARAAVVAGSPESYVVIKIVPDE